MILLFPDRDTLKLALTSGAVPVELQSKPGTSGISDAGEIVVQFAEKLPRSSAAALKRLGAKVLRRSPIGQPREFVCWHQLLPLVRRKDPPVVDQTAVLFHVEGAAAFSRLVSEILRLGNDRQSFRHFARDDGRDDGREVSLLRVVGPPYYSLLQALESTDGTIRAYVEQQSHVWVELGFEHPSGNRITPPAGKTLLISRDGSWMMLNQGVFTDVYSVLDFPLPGKELSLAATDIGQRIEVPLSLVRSTANDQPQLWVLQQNGVEQVERLLHNSDDQLISSLAFAVAVHPDGPVVVLRSRSTKKIPELVVEGLACRPFLRIPNLFVPVGKRIQPPLRRDAILQRLVADSSQITWLKPSADGRFQVERLPDAAFRPLSDWVSYIVDTSREAMAAWIESHQFAFDAFVTETESIRKKPDEKPKGPRRLELQDEDHQEEAEHSGELPDPPEPLLNDLELPESEPTANSELTEQLRELERQYVELDSPLDSPERDQLWHAMGILNARLGRRHDMTICWSNLLWGKKEAAFGSLARQWFDCELACSQFHEFGVVQIDGLKVTDDFVSRSLIAACLVHKTRAYGFASQELVQKLAHMLLRNEEVLPVRTVWLAWRAISRFTGDDTLALARTRDRLLERLFEHGLAAESDLPPFLREGVVGDNERLRAIRNGLPGLRASVDDWILEPAGQEARTRAYARLMFSFALARLGDGPESRDLLNHSTSELRKASDPIHEWVADAFQYRIEQTFRGEAEPGRLPESLTSSLEDMERNSRYVLDRLRQRCRILEPHSHVDVWNRFHGGGDELSQTILELQKTPDATELRVATEQLLADTTYQTLEDHLRILLAALDFSPRLGHTFGLLLINDHVRPMLTKLVDLVDKSALLERAMFVAAHFGLTGWVTDFLQEFERLAPDLVTEYLSIQDSRVAKSKRDAIERLFSESLGRMRRLGLRTGIEHLFTIVAEQLSDVPRRQADDGPLVRRLRLGLCLAEGWHYLGEHEKTYEIMNEVRQLLASGTLKSNEQSRLAVAYIQAASLAPVDETLTRIQELFAVDVNAHSRKMLHIEDRMFTSSHFSIMQLTIVEAVVRALASDDLQINEETRRWLDADEFLVRQQIHQDMETAMQPRGS